MMKGKLQMIYEFRRYEAALGRFSDLLNRFENVTVKLFKVHGFDPVGYWQTDVGTSNEFQYLLRWEDANQRQMRWADFLADPEWQQAKVQSEVNGALVARSHNQIWVPTRFSPIR